MEMFQVFLNVYCGLVFCLVAFTLSGTILFCFIPYIPVNLVLFPLLIVAIFVEVPAVTVGRALNLPIESGGAAFMLYNLSPFGYRYVSMFWLAAGLICKVLLKFRQSHNPTLAIR
jgi:hypothetical protein